MASSEHQTPSAPRAFDPASALPAINAVRTPRLARRLAKIVFMLFLATPVILIFVPWQQTVHGRGRVIDLDPSRREQAITARISGQIARWHVKETDHVKAGEKIVDIEDTDPEWGERLRRQRAALLAQQQQAGSQRAERASVVEAETRAKDAAVQAEKAQRIAAEKAVQSVRAALVGAEALVEYETLRYQRLENLYKSQLGGLESELNVAEARFRLRKAEADVAKLKEDLSQQEAAVKRSTAAVKKAEADGASAVADANAALRKVGQEIFSLDQQLQEIDNKIQRYEARFIRAPCDGTIFRIMSEAAQSGQYVKEGQTLALIVPDASERVVELYIEGVDAPLITRDPETGKYPRVRLQFEGWPAVQFSGWPSASIGTFGGRVFRIDPTDDGSGRFRILVKPEPYFPDDDWPEPKFLRQGNQAVGWVFLRRVSLGFELWRRMNGFPPVNPPTKSPKATAKPSGTGLTP